MTDNTHNSPTRAGGYRSPKAKVIRVSIQNLLCLSDTSIIGYSDGSHSEDDMEED